MIPAHASPNPNSSSLATVWGKPHLLNVSRSSATVLVGFFSADAWARTIDDCHACAGSLDATDLDGELTVGDIDELVARNAQGV